MNLSYNKPSPAASIGWGGFASATWGRSLTGRSGYFVAQPESDIVILYLISDIF